MMYHVKHEEHCWGVILAGGEGKRLRPITKIISGDDRPKQFCDLIGDRSLLSETRLRVLQAIPSDQIVLALTKAHERFYSVELADVPAIRMIEQPANRGTLPAILWSLLRVVRLDERAVVAFFPSDHYYNDEQGFVAKVHLAFEAAADSGSVILLGAEATYSETEYGWIEPGLEVDRSRIRPDNLLKIKRFCEKPSCELARRLLDLGCLWNTFVMVGQASAFLDLIRSTEPDVYETFEMIVDQCKSDINAELMTAFYEGIESADFCQRILTRHTDKLSVLSLGEIRWSDLGDPQRVLTILCEAVSRKPVVQPLLSTLSYLSAAG